MSAVVPIATSTCASTCAAYRFSAAQGFSAARGFSLVELMVTVVVIGILMSFAVPTFAI